MKPGPDTRFYRGLAFALPVGALMWAGIFAVVPRMTDPTLALVLGLGAFAGFLGILLALAGIAELLWGPDPDLTDGPWLP